jgi:hypothetical protein
MIFIFCFGVVGFGIVFGLLESLNPRINLSRSINKMEERESYIKVCLTITATELN